MRWQGHCGHIATSAMFLPYSRLVQRLARKPFRAMKHKSLFCSIALAASTLAAGVVPARADQASEQGQLRRERRAGTVRSTREIEQIVLPQMSGMQYLGPEYDAAAMAYRLKFIQNGRVVFVDVDARSGRIIGRSR
jgi:uncharacterized membrane protein YkoI